MTIPAVTTAATEPDVTKDGAGRYSYDYILAAYYINLAKNAGAQPVLVTPITRRNLDGKPNYSGHTDYQNAMLRLGTALNVPVIDMTAQTTKLYNDLYNYGGANETAKLHCYTDAAHTTLDNTHLSGAGAQKIASMIAAQTKALGLSIGNNSAYNTCCFHFVPPFVLLFLIAYRYCLPRMGIYASGKVRISFLQVSKYSKYVPAITRLNAN